MQDAEWQKGERERGEGMTACVWYLAGKSCGSDITASNRNTHRHKREVKVLCYTDESEGWDDGGRKRGQREKRNKGWETGEEVRDVFWWLKKEQNNKRMHETRKKRKGRKTRERGQHELNVEGVGGTRWETHAAKRTQVPRGWSLTMTSWHQMEGWHSSSFLPCSVSHC